MRSATVRLPGHPDATCGLLAESLVDEFMRRDQGSRIRLSVHGGSGALFVSGDVSSTADFDVARLLRSKMGEIGIADEIEVFAALDLRSVARAGNRLPFQTGPVHVFGAAFGETPEQVPETAALAKRIAKRLDGVRRSEPDWFWLGPDAEVTVVAENASPSLIHLEVEHGDVPLADVRRRCADELASVTSNLPILVNPSGPRERRGLALASGSSGRQVSPYGSLAPGLADFIGRDPLSPEKAGTWLARFAARQLREETGSAAVFVRAVYPPGENRPSHLKATDERGRTLPAEPVRERMDLTRVMGEWWRPGLNADAAIWGFAGELILPWES